MARPCSFWESQKDAPCAKEGFYLLELVSREGSRSQVVVCREHVHKAWEFGQRVLKIRFPKRALRLSSVRLMPILEKPAKRAMRKSAAS